MRGPVRGPSTSATLWTSRARGRDDRALGVRALQLNARSVRGTRRPGAQWHRSRVAAVHRCAYTSEVPFQWDPAKAASNLEKHDVDFADAATVFVDPRGLTMPEEHDDEQRFVTLAMDALGRVLVVVWTQRDEEIRLISARKANRRERGQYAEGE